MPLVDSRGMGSWFINIVCLEDGFCDVEYLLKIQVQLEEQGVIS